MSVKVTGKVVRLTDFGAFVELEPGVDGLLHISQMSNRPIATPADILKAQPFWAVGLLPGTDKDVRMRLTLVAAAIALFVAIDTALVVTVVTIVVVRRLLLVRAAVTRVVPRQRLVVH